HCPRHHPDLHSFPTRRSSDLSGRPTQRLDHVVGSTTGQIVANYGYADDDGLLTAISYPDFSSRNVSLTYDGYGRLSSRSDGTGTDRKSTRLNSSHLGISYAVF